MIEQQQNPTLPIRGVGRSISYDLFGNEVIENQDLKSAFLIPPFSIFDAKQDYWIKRKLKWRNLINDNGETRLMSLGNKKNNNPKDKFMAEGQGVSLLDPVIAEICIKWFGLSNCNILDPFAGDTVFGYVAGFLNNNFTGIEIRKEQANINQERTKNFNCKYICDDAQNVLNHIKENSQDLLFSCPPYFDLEIYSDLPNDASNQQNYYDYLQIIDNAFSGAIKTLKNNRFAFIVIGDVRDNKGFYRLIPDDIKQIFKKNNMHIYNEMILLEPIGSKAIVARTAMKNRKVMKSHQNILVFYKGDTKEIKNNFSELKNN